MSLSVVVPVHDDPQGLARLLHSLAAALPRPGTLAQVIVVDDGSPRPLRPALQETALPRALPLTWHRHAQPAGAGLARNAGLGLASGSHVLFLDADDTVTPALGGLLADLQGQPFDFALFAHDDSRRLSRGATGPDEAVDRAIWADLAPGPGPVALTAPQARALCRISNYPWNRIWRLGFLRDHAIGHGDTPLHNDIEPHWAGFIEARRILCSDRRCVVHNVAGGARQLTNRRGAERLCVFQALDAVAARLMARASTDAEPALFVGPFLEFTFRLLDWIESLLDDPATLSDLHRAAARFLRDLARRAPQSLAQALDRALAEEPGLALRFLHWAGDHPAREGAAGP